MDECLVLSNNEKESTLTSKFDINILKSLVYFFALSFGCFILKVYILRMYRMWGRSVQVPHALYTSSVTGNKK